MARRKKVEPHQWSVPMRLTYHGYVLVEAVDEESAIAAAERLDGEVESNMELVDWENRGEPINGE